MSSTLRLTEEQYQKLQKKPKADAVESRIVRNDRTDVASKPEYETLLENQLRDSGVLGIHREYFWARGRRYRADVAIPHCKLIVEIQGEVHRIKGKFKRDICKAQEAILQGWVLLPVSTEQVRNGDAASLVRRVISMLTVRDAPF